LANSRALELELAILPRKEKGSMFRMLSWVRLPILWGGLAYVGFYALIEVDFFPGDLVERYFNGHPVENVSAGLFFVGMATLLIKAIGLGAQSSALERVTLGPVRDGGHAVEDVHHFLQRLAQLPEWIQGGYFARRLRQALETVRRRRSADALDEHLRYLADVDLERMDGSYASVRIIVWAIPILGFLGTVIGITMAIANLSPEALETSMPQVTAGLGVAFDTTALALALAMVLMFAKYFIERLEGRLLTAVDERTAAELVGRFRQYGAERDPHVASVRRMAETVIHATETLVKQQVQLWQSTVDAAHRRWGQLVSGASTELERGLAGALSEGLKQHAAAVASGEAALAAENRKHLEQMQQGLERSVHAAARLEAELVKQGQVLRDVVESTGQVRKLEEALNKNLSTLASSKDFEEMVMSLAAAIQLLSARLHHLPSEQSRVRIPSSEPVSSAA
jgi:biopolymer transport protein ExbB/TolQ